VANGAARSHSMHWATTVAHRINVGSHPHAATKRTITMTALLLGVAIEAKLAPYALDGCVADTAETLKDKYRQAILSQTTAGG
jgi:hypothetical protein